MSINIYRIVGTNTGRCYVGQCKDMKNRINIHKITNNICSSRIITNNEPWTYEILEVVDEEDANKVEQHWIDYYVNSVNINRVVRTKDQTKVLNNKSSRKRFQKMTEEEKEVHREKARKWRRENKEKLKAYDKEHKSIRFNCLCGKNRNKDGKRKHLRSNQHKEDFRKLLLEEIQMMKLVAEIFTL